MCIYSLLIYTCVYTSTYYIHSYCICTTNPLHTCVYIHKSVKTESLLRRGCRDHPQGPCGLAIASGLWPSYLEIALGSEGPAADGAAEGLLPSVGAFMDLQGTG